MALTPIETPLYPNVPRAPGVPPVLRRVGEIANPIVLLVADALSVLRMFQPPQWGIFSTSGQPVLIGDSVIAVDYRQEFRIADYPIEEGSFATYNKVREPFDIRVIFACSGQQTMFSSILSGGAIGALITGTNPSLAARSAFLEAVERTAGSLGLLNVVTPERTYRGVNLTHVDYRRSPRGGATLIQVEVWCRQVRTSARGTFTKTKQPSGTAPIDEGTAQASNAAVSGLPAAPDGLSPGAASSNFRPGDSSGGGPEIPSVGARFQRSGEIPLYNTDGLYVGPLGPNEAVPPGYTVGPATP